ncbi:AraC family transcriptional regulator [Persicobacter psychrovividus]|uniref:AraC family transcriptional regulator n=1 Tax=Persicobacter psychrovividus TaxID=387638 RepID=A0ABM7VLQ5_9BACT|nr:AraC family transcriptional regulator [Persicobacter psychrovividus]
MIFDKVPFAEHQAYMIRYFEIPYVDYPLHQHDAYELTFTQNSYGTRLIGNSIDPFHENDLALIGPNLPHQWQNDEVYINSKHEKILLTVVHFTEQGLTQILEQPAGQKIKKLLEDSQKGIAFDKIIVDQILVLLQKMKSTDTMEGYLAFLQMLHTLADADHYRQLSTASFVGGNERNEQRIKSAYRYIHENFKNDICLNDVADHLCMSASAFAHFFKKNTGFTFSSFINESRIAVACEMLQYGQQSISSICYEVGFQNLSYFNRVFKKIKGLSPLEFRQAFQKNYAPAALSNT